MKTLKDLKKEATPLEKYIINDLLYDNKTNEDVNNYINNILNHGCQSGVVCSLIYYHDTVKFFDKFVDEINELLKDMMYDSGLPINKLFGDKFDDDDPLCKDTQNKNLLAWFAFEETTRQIADKIGIEV